MIRDLQFLLSAEGRDYVIEICAPSRNPAPVSAGPFDVHITVCVAELVPNWRELEPELVVRPVADYVVPLVPASVRRDDWTRFADAVLAWVCAHRDITA